MQNSEKIIIGTWSLSGDFGYIENKESINIIEHAINNGFYEFDLAPNYGKGRIYNIFKKIVSTNKTKLKINTKCGNNFAGDKSFLLEDLKKSIEQSLEFFGKINILFLHNPRNEITDWDALLKLLSEYKNSGLINKIGISIARNHYFRPEILNLFDWIQDEINLLRVHPLKKLIDIKAKIMSRSPYASGILTGEININRKFDDNDYRVSWLNGKRLESIIKQVDCLNNISNDNILELAKNFLFSQKKIDKIIFGIKSKQHVDELLKNNKDNIILSSDIINNIFELEKKNYGLPSNELGY